MWQDARKKAPAPGWQQFQRDFRNLNPHVGANGHLKLGATYLVPSYTPPAKDPASMSSNPAPRGDFGPPAAEWAPTGLADGSSPAKAIPVTGAQVFESVSMDQLLDGAGADALVVAVKGTVGVQEIPGWDKIPGLKNLGKDATIGYLFAALTPFSVGAGKDGVSVTADPLATTMFMSLTIPGVKNPVVFTVKLSEMNFEGGQAIKNIAFKDVKLAGNRDAIVFSNWRVGGSGNNPDNEAVASVNGGFLVKSDGLKHTVKSIKDLVKTVMRTAQAAEAVTAAAAAPETGGGSLVAGAASIAGTELGRGAIFKSLDKADLYVGLAWRGSTGLGFDNGKVTVLATKGGLNGKWITVNLADIPGSFFDSKTPDYSAPDKEWLIAQGTNPETAGIIAERYRDGESVRPVIEQMAEHLQVSVPELMGWFNKLSTSDAAKFTDLDLNRVYPDDNGVYSVHPSDPGHEWPPNSLADLVTLCGLRTRYPQLPRGA